MEGLDLRALRHATPLSEADTGTRFVGRMSQSISLENQNLLVGKLKDLAKNPIRILLVDCSSFEVAVFGSQRLLLAGPKYLGKSSPGVMSLGMARIHLQEKDVVVVRVLTDRRRKEKSFLSAVREWADPIPVESFRVS